MVLPHVRRHSGNGPTPRKKAFSLWSDGHIRKRCCNGPFPYKGVPVIVLPYIKRRSGLGPTLRTCSCNGTTTYKKSVS